MAHIVANVLEYKIVQMGNTQKQLYRVAEKYWRVLLRELIFLSLLNRLYLYLQFCILNVFVVV